MPKHMVKEQKKKAVAILVLLVILAPSAFALFEFDEFTDDFGQFIQETVENEEGNVCLNCNVSITVNFPNGTFHVFKLMPFNASSNKYDILLNLSLVHANTTVYPITIIANRTTGSIIRNGTSDRTQLVIYDVFPPTDNFWDVGLVVMFITIQGILLYFFLRFDSEQIFVKHLFAGFAVGINVILFRIGNRILVSQGVTSSDFLNVIDSANVVSIWLLYFFLVYILIYMIYFFTNMAMAQSRLMRGGRV